MRIELRDSERQRIGRIDVDSAQRPTRVAVEGFRSATLNVWNRFRTRFQDGFAKPRHSSEPVPRPDPETLRGSREVFLNWDTALDDAGQLRRCLACGCTDLFREKSFPQVTGFVVLLAFIGAVVGALGLATNLPVLFAMASVLVLDIAILVLSRRRLVCYRCRTTYLHLPIARYHGPWDRAVADRHPPPIRPKPEDEVVIGESESAVSATPSTNLRAQKGSLA